MIEHSPTCARVFKRYDPSCARCQELSQGAPAREGWGQLKREAEAREARWLREHNCQTAHCGPVCTYGDW